jgi:hypothetical protein
MKKIILLFTLLLLTLSISFETCQASSKTYIVTSVLSSDKDGLQETDIFDTKYHMVYWTGTVKSVSVWDNSRSTAEWYSPDGKLYSSDTFTFDPATKKAVISLNIGENPWTRVPTGLWALRVTRKGYEGISISFKVEKVEAPENFAKLYETLATNYEQMFKTCSTSLESEATMISETKLDLYKDETHLSVFCIYLNTFNTARTTTQTRISTLIMKAGLKTLKTMYLNFNESGEIKGYMFEILGISYNYTSKNDFKIEKVKLIVKPDILKKYIDLDITAQELVKNSIVIINDERVEFTLQSM